MNKKEKVKGIRKELEEDSKRAIERHLCKKCGGVIVNSWISGTMAAAYGKRCECEER